VSISFESNQKLKQSLYTFANTITKGRNINYGYKGKNNYKIHND